MMDVGWGEILVLGVVALLIFGPDRLPKAAADAGRMVRKLREMAASAQTELKESGVDVSGITNDIKSVADLHPKRIMSATVADIRNAGNPVAQPQAVQAGSDAPSGTKEAAPSAIAPSTPQRIDPDAT